MTPDTLTLARTIGKLPGAPTHPTRRIAMDLPNDHRDHDGLRWIVTPNPDGGPLVWVLDLNDAATGGVMLARVGVDFGAITTPEGWSVCDHKDPRSRVYVGPTLAAALARLILARGSWT